MIRRFFRFIYISIALLTLLGIAVGLMATIYFYIEITRDLPKIEKLSDYQPKAATLLYAKDGTLIAEMSEEQRYPVKLDEVPMIVRNAFLAAEDAGFYRHVGIDFFGILRALWKNLKTNQPTQGASTITQQVVKSLLLTREKTYERKAKEAILSYRLERALSKNEIFEIYLNEIFLGSGAYGIKAAARAHFGKNLNELNVAEAAFLAGLPQRPSYLTSPKHRSQAIERQHYTLRQMVANGMITKEEEIIAKNTELDIKPQALERIYAAPYYSNHAMREVDRIFEENIPGDETALNPGGYVVETTADIPAYRYAEKAVRTGLKELDKRRGWRGPKKSLSADQVESLIQSSPLTKRNQLIADDIYPAVVTSTNGASGILDVTVGTLKGKLDVNKADWAKKLLGKEDRATWITPKTAFKVGDLIEVSLNTEKTTDTQLYFSLDQTPEAEAALVSLNALTGEVATIIGGYDYNRSVFNRATQGRLQPGSAFKPIIYLTAVNNLNYTASSIVPDSPISLVAGNGKLWSPQNYDRKFLGPITMRTALQRSRNVVSVALIRKTGLDAVIDFAHKMGITSPIQKNLSISLGTAEVSPLELTRAYGVFAAGGWLAESIFVTSITDRNGKVIYEKHPSQKKVISDEVAFIMANMMKGVVERGTAQVVKQLEKPVAGKTGTTNDVMDTWFIGYTPEWVTGVWVGFDVKRNLGRFETGGKTAAPIFVNYMREFLKDTPPLDFDIPDSVIPVTVDLNSGRPVEPDSPNAFVEYFISGTEPTGGGMDSPTDKDYLMDNEF